MSDTPKEVTDSPQVDMTGGSEGTNRNGAAAAARHDSQGAGPAPSGPDGTVDVEALVARYAPIGQRHRRAIRLKRGATVLGAVLGVLVIALLARTALRGGTGNAPAAGAMPPAAAPGVATGLDAGTSPKPEAPDEQLLRSEGQHKLLSDALREIAAQRRAIDQRLAASVGDRQPADNEIAAFNQQRRVLEAQHRQFEAQASQLARKIGVLKGRREGTHAPAPGTPGAR